ncbi:Hcp family type VI secretion system effector [Roseomonas rosulenta]|uniref:Hcp family type VI secretion system effector n=1 Tax=Roseomonas rosulenta TaxID=2748667 RepID=UPI0018E05AD7|nr:type VI secretion system tube protein Hcp [Roseomonas rosulenta]
MPIVMKYQGIDGESTIEGFAKYTELSSFEFGVGRRIASARGTSTREGGDANLSEIVVRKKTDGTTIKYFEEACTGKLNKDVEIGFLRTGAGKSEEYLNFKMQGCGVAGLSFKSSGGQDVRPEEVLHLNFDKLTVKYNPIGDDFSGNPASYGWDLAKATKL